MGWQDAPLVQQPAPNAPGPQSMPVTEQDWMNAAQGTYNAGASAPGSQAGLPLRDVPRMAWENLPNSAGQFVNDITYPIRHPIKTGEALINVAAGALQNALPDSVVRAGLQVNNALADMGLPVVRLPDDPSDNEAVQAANAVGQFFADRYGGWENFKRTMATDPVGFLSDAASVVSLGAGTAAKLPGTAGKIAGGFKTAADWTDPAALAGRAVAGTARFGVNTALPGALGVSTGVGSDTVRTAASAGYRGGQSAQDFQRAMRGADSMTTILDDAKAALAQMRANRSAAYTQGMESTRAATQALDFGKVDKAFQDVVATMYSPQGMPKIDPQEMAQIQRIADALDQWRANPNAHTAIEMDALKQRIGNLVSDNPEYRQLGRVKTAVQDAIRNEIASNVPEYADTMRAYEDASKLIEEIERSLSLNDRASADTALRKLQSLTRNNVQTNYGNRLDVARELERQGNVNILDRVSGQAMSSWEPRGLSRVPALGAMTGGMAVDPLFFAALPAQSPRVVGEAALAAGRGASLLRNMPRPHSSLAARLLYQSGRGAQEVELTPEQQAMARALMQQ